MSTTYSAKPSSSAPGSLDLFSTDDTGAVTKLSTGTPDAINAVVAGNAPAPTAAPTPAPAAKPVASLSSAAGATAVQDAQTTQTRLNGTTPTTPVQTPASDPTKTDKTPTDTSSNTVVLVNPDTDQKVTFNNADTNKEQIQAFLSMGYKLSEANGYAPSWLSGSGSSTSSSSTTGTGSGDPLTDPAAAKTALATAQTDLNNAKAKLTSFDVSQDPALQSLLSSIGSQWDTRIATMQQANDAQIAAYNTTGIRMGSQYTGGNGGVFGSIISAAEKNAMDSISTLQSQKQQALTEAQNAYENQQWTRYSTLVDLAQTAYNNQLDAVKALNTATIAANAKIQERSDQSQRDSAIATFVQNGITDPAKILSTANSLGYSLTAQDVKDGLTNLGSFVDDRKAITDLAQTAKNNGASTDIVNGILSSKDLGGAYSAAGNYSSGGTGIIAEYNYAKANGYTGSFNDYQNADANRKAKATAGASGGLGAADLATFDKAVSDKLVASGFNQLPGSTQNLAIQLVTGQLAPSELSKRTTGTANYNDAIAAANAYSVATTGKPFNFATADRNYKFANNPQTQNTLNYLGSLVGSDNGDGTMSGGNLDDLVTLSNNITRTSFPAINNIAMWAKYSAGDPNIAAFQATATEVADQVAKILQGGGNSGTSDAKLQQAANLFNTSFTKDQLIATVKALKPLLQNRAESMIKNNPYLSDYADQFGVDQGQKTSAEQAGLDDNKKKTSIATWVTQSAANAQAYQSAKKFFPDASTDELMQQLGIQP